MAERHGRDGGGSGDEAVVDLLRSAAPQQLPPARFGHADVVAASGRARRRRRQLLAGVAAVVVVGLGSAGAVAALDRSTGATSTASSGLAPEAAATGGLQPQVLGQEGSPGPCGPVDDTVRAAVATARPALTGFVALGSRCPAGTTGLAAGTGAARVEVFLGPAPVAADDPSASAVTADGRTVTVVGAQAAELATAVADALG